MEAEVPRQLVEDLLTSFLSAALGLELLLNIEHLEKLSIIHRQRVQPEVGGKLIWVAWQTNLGVVAATGRYDHDQSRRLAAHVLLIDWWLPSGTHHSSWWRANPKRPTEWTAGRGCHREPR